MPLTNLSLTLSPILAFQLEKLDGTRLTWVWFIAGFVWFGLLVLFDLVFGLVLLVVLVFLINLSLPWWAVTRGN